MNKSFLIFTLFFLTACSFNGYAHRKQFSLVPPAYSNLSYAESGKMLRSEGKLIEAIEQYELHIAKRLLTRNKSERENPYFYYLIIGDIYLEMNDPDNAFFSYLIAEAHQISPTLISDRLRLVAIWYENNNQLDMAIEFLKTNRAVDELLFDAEIDRLHKKAVGLEQES